MGTSVTAVPDGQRRSKLIQDFIVWLILRCFIPLLPILVRFCISFYRTDYDYIFPDITVITLAFLFPVITMTEKPDVGAITMFFLLLPSFAALILFVLAIIADITNDQVQLDRICETGAILLGCVITVHIIPRLFKLIREY